MFDRLLTPRAFQTRVLLTLALVACLVWLALTFFRGVRPDAVNPVRATSESAQPGSSGKENTSPKLEGAAARKYLDQTDDGQSLMQAVTIARFGLKWQERAPFGVETSNLSGVLST